MDLGLRRSGRAAATGGNHAGRRLYLPSVDDATAEMLEPLGLHFLVGGADVGGIEATKLLASSFSNLDKSVLALTGDFSTAERCVLERHGKIVAAAVVLVHAEPTLRILELPIFAADKTTRRKGFGTILSCLLCCLAGRIGLRENLASHVALMHG